jgi:two-component system OmpR family response regulator
MTTLLLAEDDRLLADALSAQLARAGFKVEHATNGAVAEYLLGRMPIDLAIVDIGLPLIDGLTVLRNARQARNPVPVIVLTALDSLEDRVAGLNAGADDYMTKPFDFPELEARVHALLRRLRPASRNPLHGRLSFDRDARRAAIGDEPLELSPREWSLLELLLTRRDSVVTKAQINAVWDQERADGTATAGNSIEVHIHRLRRKLEDSGVSIRTVRGLGYLLEDETPAP